MSERRSECQRGRRVHSFLENFEKAKSWLEKLGIPNRKVNFLSAYFAMSLGGWTDTEAWADAERLFPQERVEEDS